MSLHKIHSESHKIYFCTITCYRWLPLFSESNAYHAVYKWFDHLRKDGCKVIGYVIMPNHLHALLYLPQEGASLNYLVGEGKRFMAYAIVNALKKSGKDDLLNLLQEGVEPKERLKGKKHQVFKLSFDARVCYNDYMVEQKLDYIHHNPVKGKWGLVENFVEYPYSSAPFYELGADEKFLTNYKVLDAGTVSEGSESSSSDSERG